jgi:hypothetical protein
MNSYEWLKNVGPFLVGVGWLTLSLAIFGVTLWFSRWQVHLAKQKLRHDLYNRRFAIYIAFQELLLALVEKDDGEIRAAFRKAYIARSESQFLLADPQIQLYLDNLYKQVKDDIIAHIMFLQASEGAIVNDPQIRRDVAERASLLATAKLNLADRHLAKLSQEFARFLKLTDFWN